MTEISTEEFIEFVRLSHSWSDLARRCVGERANKKRGDIRNRLAKLLKEKVLLLNLDIQHFTSMGRRTHAPLREVGEDTEADETDATGETDAAGEGGRGGKRDELTCRLISLYNNVIDEGQLRLLHGFARGHTLEEFEAYVKLWRPFCCERHGLEEYVQLWRYVVDEREDYVRKYPTNVGEIGVLLC
jgi:hypothetical protein